MNIPANDNHRRPASFDALLLQWTPFLHKLSLNFEHDAQDREDLVNETITVALHRWGNYRTDASFPGWLSFQMRSCVSARMRKQHADVRWIARVNPEWNSTAQPNQDDVVELSQVIGMLNPGRDRDVFLRVIDGESGQVLADEYGISRERVRQIVARQRKTICQSIAATERRAA
ncbi:sigma-70 family RNA polymerase sigma factor [Falsochrobactrum ovis]|uniref:RNA polymerase sigma factor (Sigma-70 family) n=1 Tax=Falsochrobactrum ovis TaxID=1293442 RepID=A0A364JT39_9HYPH|nr:sigma-70 family RNA polymerase sigma factor [Falsochrobactrum ovis]RAK26349.1 RNA polymerase sigma factor (sigma-70 family) [Falsochrobactrum ovis]